VRASAVSNRWRNDTADIPPPGPARHPDAERLAEYADGLLAAGARDAIERHLAACDDCRSVVTDTIVFLQPRSGTAIGRVVRAVVRFLVAVPGLLPR
jgi:hypothetical protein